MNTLFFSPDTQICFQFSDSLCRIGVQWNAGKVKELIKWNHVEKVWRWNVSAEEPTVEDISWRETSIINFLWDVTSRRVGREQWSCKAFCFSWKVSVVVFSHMNDFQDSLCHKLLSLGLSWMYASVNVSIWVPRVQNNCFSLTKVKVACAQRKNNNLHSDWVILT